MSPMPVKKRKCARCGVEYVDDSVTFCIDCDVATLGGPLNLAAPSLHPDAHRRVREMRQWKQAKILAEAEGIALPLAPAWLRPIDIEGSGK